MNAAHPQQSTGADPAAEQPASAPAGDAGRAPSNPLPTQMMVMGLDGMPVHVHLAWSEGVLFAPDIDDLAVSPETRQYITQYCAMWTSSMPVTGKVRTQYPPQPRRGQLVFRESQLHSMLGLADDESVVRVVVDPVDNMVRFVIDSPRLAPYLWDSEPPIIGLPVSAWYEGRQGDGDPGGVQAAQQQADALRARAAVAAREWATAIAAAERRVDAMLQAGEAGQGVQS